MDRQLCMDRNQFPCQNLESCCSLCNCTVTLQNLELWKMFNEQGTEMIVTKNGRKMFPSFVVKMEGLNPREYYCVFLEMAPASRYRHKYTVSGGWTPAGPEEAQSNIRTYLHPDSPATGEFWMSQQVSFGKMKVTNTPSPPPGHIVLSSMHKYQPKIIIAKTSDPRSLGWPTPRCITFPETSFIAVTAYQNEKITQLKIDYNPFAKGFRETGQSKCKRKRIPDETGAQKKKIRKENDDVSSDESIIRSHRPTCSKAVSPGIIQSSQHRGVSPSSSTSGYISPLACSEASTSSESASSTEGLHRSFSPTIPSTQIPFVPYPVRSQNHPGLTYPIYNMPYPYNYVWPEAMNPMTFLSCSPYYSMYYQPSTMWGALPLPVPQPNREPEDLRVLQPVQPETRTFTDFSINAIISCKK